MKTPYDIEELEATQTLLLLVLDKKIPLKTIKGWTARQYLDVKKWAYASYLRASDNNVCVPPKPTCLAATAAA